MASASAYDEKLLSQAPEVTKADLQDGYNADLLREAAVKRSPSARVASTPPPLRSNSDQQYHQHDKDVESAAAPLQPKENVTYQEPRKPWWRTVKGIAIIGVVAIIIILAAVLGGVLGSRKSKPSVDASNQGQTGSSGSGTGPEQGLPGSSSGSASASGLATSTSSSIVPASSTVTQPSAGDLGNGSSNGGASQGGSGGNGSSDTSPSASNNINGGRPVQGGTPEATDGNGSSSKRRSEGLVVEVMLRDLGVQL